MNSFLINNNQELHMAFNDHDVAAMLRNVTVRVGGEVSLSDALLVFRNSAP